MATVVDAGGGMAVMVSNEVGEGERGAAVVVDAGGSGSAVVVNAENK